MHELWEARKWDYEKYRNKKEEYSWVSFEGAHVLCSICYVMYISTLIFDVFLWQVCDDLRIFCSRCSGEQLEILKGTGVIPPSAPSCGLVKKTDAERLVNSLLHRNPPKSAVSVLSAVNRPQDPNKPQSHSHFRVYHECFGEGRGVVLPHLYDKTDALCIE